MHFEDSKSAAEAAAESAKKAIAAAEVAAYLAKKEEATQPSFYDDKSNNTGINPGFFRTNDPAIYSQNMHRSHSLPRPDHIKSEDTLPANMYSGGGYRRYSYNPSSTHSDIKFDESDCDEEIEREAPPVVLPPNRPPPLVPSSQVKRDGSPCVHPKLPDYDELAARFEALKFKKSQF